MSEALRSSATSLAEFRGKRVLVVGDMVLDEYIIGTPARISREAPVLILHHSEEFVCPGGAGNVAGNLAALGAETSVAGVIGQDANGNRLRDALGNLGIDMSGLVEDPARRTATKSRVVGRGDQEIQQQIVRIDRVDTSAVEGEVASRLTEVIHSALDVVDAVVISDYENGVISPQVLSATLPKAQARGMTIAVDSHGDLFRFQGITVATPNQPEAESTLGRQIRTLEELETAGEELRHGMRAEGVLITRGSQGMSLFQRGHPPLHLPPTNLREVFDPSGAGDTACAVFTLAILSGLSMGEAAGLSNIAAGEVVKRLGAATLSWDALVRASDQTHDHASPLGASGCWS